MPRSTLLLLTVLTTLAAIYFSEPLALLLMGSDWYTRF